VGHVVVPRRYYACRHCKAKQTPWESWAGVTGVHRVTPHARRMVVLAGSGCSFDEAARNLSELCHLQLSNDVVRRVCDEEGKAVREWMNHSSEPKKAFDAAEGAVEFSTDGLKINTVDGWREIRQSVIADGAKWIWDQAAKRFGDQDAQWVVDVYHVMLYLFAAAAALGPEAAKQWVHGRVIELIEKGGPKFIEHLKGIGPPDASAATTEAWAKLLNYLRDNRDSLWYGRRLQEGLPIGSGLIEGAGKNTLARRLKINSARWRIRRAERMGAIRCLQYSGLWESYWESKLAA
jgi:hypothetical protein